MYGALAAAIGQSASDTTGGFVNGAWNLFNENSEKEKQSLETLYNQNLMTWQNQLNGIAAQQAYEHQKSLLELQAQYNSPMYLMQQALKAGLNPNVIFGKGNSSASVPSAPSVAAPQTGLAGVGAVAGGAHFPFSGLNVSQIAKAVESLAAADKMGVETEQVKQTIDSIVQQEKSKAALLEINAQLASKFGDQKEQMQILSLYASAYQSIEAGNKDGAEKALIIAKEATEKVIARMKGFEAKSAQIIADNMQAKCQADIDNIKSSSEKNRAQANEANANAQTVNDLRDSLVKIKYQELKTSEFARRSAALDMLNSFEEYQNKRLTPEQRKLFVDKVTETLKNELTEEEWKRIVSSNPSVGILGGFLNSVGSAVIGSAIKLAK